MNVVRDASFQNLPLHIFQDPQYRRTPTLQFPLTELSQRETIYF